MGSEFPKISKKLIKQLNRIKTDSSVIRDAKNKLEIFAVKCGLKSAFLSGAYDISPFKKIALLLNLKFKETKFVPPYMSRKPKVNESFWKASLEVWCSGLAFWAYQNDVIEPMISKCLSGKLNPGYILGYPECCVRWHANIRAPEIESAFQSIMETISRDPNFLNGSKGTSEEEMFKRVISNWKMPMPNYALKTEMIFPYVPHWACPSCLNGELKATEEMNLQYRELALNLNPDYIQIIEDSI